MPVISSIVLFAKQSAFSTNYATAVLLSVKGINYIEWRKLESEISDGIAPVDAPAKYRAKCLPQWTARHLGFAAFFPIIISRHIHCEPAFHYQQLIHSLSGSQTSLNNKKTKPC